MGTLQKARRHHDQRDVRLRGARDHVLDEVAVARRIDDGVVPLLRVEPALADCPPVLTSNHSSALETDHCLCPGFRLAYTMSGPVDTRKKNTRPAVRATPEILPADSFVVHEMVTPRSRSSFWRSM